MMMTRAQVEVTVDLTTLTDRDSVSPWVPVPEWARSMGVYAKGGAGWGSVTPAVVAIEHGPSPLVDRGGAGVAFSTPINFSADTYAEDSVATKPAVRARVTTVGAGGTVNTAAKILLVFSEAEMV